MERRPPQRGDSTDSNTGSVAEGGPPRRRALRRASHVTTTKGQPVPSIEAVIRVDPPRSKTSMSNGTHGRPHSNSVPVSSASHSTHASGTISRRRSDGSASLGVGRSIRRTLKGVVSSRSRSRQREDAAVSVDSAGSSSGSSLSRSISNASAPRGVHSDTAPQAATRRKASIKGHIRSASDVIYGWTKPPRLASSISEPLPVHSTSPHTTFEGGMVTTPMPVGSPDALPSALHLDVADEQAMRPPLSPIREPPPPVDTAVPPTPDNAATPLSPESSLAASDDVPIPPLLLNGVPMMKVSAKKQKRYFFRLDPDEGQIVWRSKKLHIIPIESIKEIRTGADARYYREQFQLAAQYEDRWLTLVYILDGSYKTLHLIAATPDIFEMWSTTIHRLYDIRKQLMSGLGHGALRQVVWEKQFWKGADEEKDQRLDFDDVERMCRRLNINPSRDDLLRRFKQADTNKRDYLDFADFRKFVKALKARPEVDRLFKRLCHDSGSTDDTLQYPAFAVFMREQQQSTLSEEELQRLFIKYASLPIAASGNASSSPPGSPARNALELTIHSAAITAGLDPGTPDLASDTTSGASISPVLPEASPSASPPPPSVQLTYETGKMTSKMFTTFLLSADNGAFREEKHDMTRPLPEYYISSSHNTYLVGHQLVGESTIEGYIRALLHSCRSVEVDIYDGETEPVIYHGKTLTTKVPLRDICQAIARYAFVASPYPIIISAEVHCGLPQQALIASIMSDVFGDALVKCSPQERPKIDVLPSPDDLKGKVMLKTKNLYVSHKEDSAGDKDTALVETESSSTETASDTDFREEMRHEWRKAKEGEVEMLKGFKSELTKAKKIMDRVNPRRTSNPSSSRPSVSPNLPVARLPEKPKVKMSMELVALLVYTVGVKCRGLNKKEVYAPEHMFSLSENSANKLLKQGMTDLIKHCRTHLVRIYPKGMRIGSTNYEPHRYWSAGAQLVALNWQTFDLGYMINHAMFQRNQRAGLVLKPLALRSADKSLLAKRTQHFLEITIISAQQLPRPKNAQGREIIDRSILDPFVEVSLHVPDWTQEPFLPAAGGGRSYSPPHNTAPAASGATSARTITVKTGVVKNNGFNPVWEQALSLPFDCVGDMLDLVFVRFAVKQEDKEDEEPIALYCTSLASLNSGYRHLPLHDCQLSQYLFSTLFIHTNIREA